MLDDRYVSNSQVLKEGGGCGAIVLFHSQLPGAAGALLQNPSGFLPLQRKRMPVGWNEVTRWAIEDTLQRGRATSNRSVTEEEKSFPSLFKSKKPAVEEPAISFFIDFTDTSAYPMDCGWLGDERPWLISQ